MKRLSLILPVLVFALFGMGCASTRPVAPVQGFVNNLDSLDKVKQAITAGALERGWTFQSKDANNMELLLNTRDHMVKVNVAYDTKSYTITYLDSANMKYNPKRHSIHNKYSKWIAALKKSIDKNMIR